MELIDRYLQSVKSMLPRKQQDDVIRELSDEVLSQAEAKEAALGRPLTEDEQAALLKQIGHPMLLASRYRKQGYLIDPAIFAIYWMVLRLVLLVVFFGMAIGAVATAATGQGLGRALGILFRYPFAALSTFAWVTLVFVAFDIIQVKFDFFAKWDPRTLPKLTKKEPKHSMAESVAALIFGAIFGVWWLVGLKHQFLILGPGVAAVHFGPVWQTLYPLFVVLVVADLIRHSIDLLRPGWERGRVAFRLFFRAMNLLVLYFLVNATDVLLGSNPNIQPFMANLNHGIHVALIIIAVIAVAQAMWDAYCLIGRRIGNGERAMVCF
ncbi:MAG TPA: hypothetical protein VE779_12535 [Candidatus Angelobacter sp.]|nr:hypothetical protein [Candidatus Angelobacter sp.]